MHPLPCIQSKVSAADNLVDIHNIPKNLRPGNKEDKRTRCLSLRLLLPYLFPSVMFFDGSVFPSIPKQWNFVLHWQLPAHPAPHWVRAVTDRARHDPYCGDASRKYESRLVKVLATNKNWQTNMVILDVDDSTRVCSSSVCFSLFICGNVGPYRSLGSSYVKVFLRLHLYHARHVYYKPNS